MKPTTNRPFDCLEKIFHEPNRLAIMSALCAADGGVPFTDLKTSCRLTDGNLSRHLKLLEETGAIRVDKSFVQLRPRTTVHLTKVGFKRFNEYLAALTTVLEQARQATGSECAKSLRPIVGKTLPA